VDIDFPEPEESKDEKCSYEEETPPTEDLFPEVVLPSLPYRQDPDFEPHSMRLICNYTSYYLTADMVSRSKRLTREMKSDKKLVTIELGPEYDVRYDGCCLLKELLLVLRSKLIGPNPGFLQMAHLFALGYKLELMDVFLNSMADIMIAHVPKSNEVKGAHDMLDALLLLRPQSLGTKKKPSPSRKVRLVLLHRLLVGTTAKVLAVVLDRIKRELTPEEWTANLMERENDKDKEEAEAEAEEEE
jgi:hypothetical protein